jgi:alpha-L-fucosidase
MWFDGANGGNGYYGGTNETRKIDGATYYDWPRTLELVRKMQPNVLFFSDAGPDLRWCGNERGTAGETNWNTITNDTLFAGKPRIERLLNTGSEDGKKWVPSEVDVSIRKGWFYHPQEDSLVKSPETLFKIYLTTVGRGSTLLLNVPPDKRGLFHENDVKALQGFKQLLDKEFKTNLAKNAIVKSNDVRGNDAAYASARVTDGRKDTYWATNDNITKGFLEIDLGKIQPVKYVLVQEYIRLGQRVKAFSVDVWSDNEWRKVASATTIGYKRILKLDDVKTNKIRINIEAAKACPLISNAEIY